MALARSVFPLARARVSSRSKRWERCDALEVETARRERETAQKGMKTHNHTRETQIYMVSDMEFIHIYWYLAKRWIKDKKIGVKGFTSTEKRPRLGPRRND